MRTVGGGGAAAGVSILPYDAAFEADLVEICWKTGLMGESLEGTGRFEDRRLFALIFALPFARFDPGLCRVAVAPASGAPGDRPRAVGYILGARDNDAAERFFNRRFAPRILARLLFYDSWRHPESFRQVMRFLKAEKAADGNAAQAAGTELARDLAPEDLVHEDLVHEEGYKARLHINLHPDYQGLGLGGRLMESFLAGLREEGIEGVALETSSRNDKALPFYEKLGFRLVSRMPMEMWEGLPALGLKYELGLGKGHPEGDRAPSRGFSS
jgi:ribosomal protein S18 acetylase RimI-like enzyme